MRYLQFRNWKTGATGRRVDVTGQSERQVARCLRGMLINIGDDWLVDDVEEPAPPRASPNQEGER